MILPQVSQDPAFAAIQLINEYVQDYNDFAQVDVLRFKGKWNKFWDSNLSQDILQAVIDGMASKVFDDDNGKPTNLWIQYYTAATAEFLDVQRVTPTAFDDGRMESTGILQPTGQPYREFFTVGWYWKIDETKPSGMLVTFPCVWVE